VLSELSTEESKESETFPNGARLGHMHLRVTNLEESVRFYHDLLGLAVTTDWSRMGAMFLSAGGYHHHVGINTWHSLNGKRHEEGENGLDAFSIELPRNEFDSFSRSLESKLNGSAIIKRKEGELSISDPDGIPIIIKPVVMKG